MPRSDFADLRCAMHRRRSSTSNLVPHHPIPSNTVLPHQPHSKLFSPPPSSPPPSSPTPPSPPAYPSPPPTSTRPQHPDSTYPSTSPPHFPSAVGNPCLHAYTARMDHPARKLQRWQLCQRCRKGRRQGIDRAPSPGRSRGSGAGGSRRGRLGGEIVGGGGRLGGGGHFGGAGGRGRGGRW